jgi:hypothetical protein
MSVVLALSGDVIVSCILVQVLDPGDCWASRSYRFIPGEEVRGQHWIKTWVDPRTDLDLVVKI